MKEPDEENSMLTWYKGHPESCCNGCTLIKHVCNMKSKATVEAENYQKPYKYGNKASSVDKQRIKNCAAMVPKHLDIKSPRR